MACGGLKFSKASFLVQISQRIIPNEKISDFAVKICLEMNSGAMYFTVAIEVVFKLLSSNLANLK
jgi:hypothetical protein